jgi:hypothetical protein
MIFDTVELGGHIVLFVSPAKAPNAQQGCNHSQSQGGSLCCIICILIESLCLGMNQQNTLQILSSRSTTIDHPHQQFDHTEAGAFALLL